jgi:hypothetical protein
MLVSGRGFLVSVILSSTACNAILGMVDVTPQSPSVTDASVACPINSRFGMVNSDASTTLSRLTNNGAPYSSLEFLLNPDTEPDYLLVELYDNMGQHGSLLTPGSTNVLTPADAVSSSCGICVSIEVNFDTGTSLVREAYWALGEGSLTVREADVNHLAGKLHGLRFRRVTTSGPTMDVADNCSVVIDDVDFNVPYTTSFIP